MKAKGSLTNTHMCVIQGVTMLKYKVTTPYLTVRFTSDEHGETISIADETMGLMFAVPFKEVEKIIKDARKERKGAVN